MIDIILILILLGSLGGVVVLVSRRAEALADVSDMTLVMYYEERFGRILFTYRKVENFLLEGGYKDKLLEYSCRILHRLHILLMRIDNGVVLLLKRSRSKAGIVNGDGKSADSSL